MYKRLYLNREVPPDRRSYNLVTHDIEGARPKLWVHPEKVFFQKNDPETHLAIQNEQYNDALHENLQYSHKEREPDWKYGRKVDFPDLRAKRSVISQDQLVTKKQELEDNRQAKQVFYPRNLNVKDIEGTEVGSLNTKFMKNWALANNLKQQQGAREKLQVDIRYPYGDGINKEDYMPDNLRHAREMANLNRNKLRVMTNVERDPQTKQFFRGNNGQIDARDGGHQSDWHIDRQFPGSTPQQYYKQPEDIKSLEHQFSDGKEMYHKLRDLNCKNAPITYESSPQQNHELPNLGSRLPPDRSPYINQSSIPKEKIERRFESVSHPNLNNKLRGAINAGRDYQLPSINAREVGDRQPRDLEAKSNQELLSDIYKREQYLKDLDEQIKKEKEMLANLEQQELEYESQAKIDQGGATNNMSTNQRRYSQEEYEAYNRYLQEQGYNPNTYGSVPDARHGGYPQKGDPRRMPDYSSASPQPNRPDSDAYYRPSSQENRQVKDPRSPPTEVKVNPREVTFKGEPGKDMFRNTDEFNYFNKLSAEDKKMYMAAFLRGQKGREFCLDNNNSGRLKQLNDFYENYLSEQYKRRTPMLPDDYRYRTMVNHLKKNNIL